MYAASVNKNFDVKTAYQRAHYYEKEHKIRVIPTIRDRLTSRPDLYYYDPIINEKYSVYRRSYYKKKPIDSENYRKIDVLEKPALKNLYDEFNNKPIKELKHKETITGSDFKNPLQSVEAQLQAKICKDCSTNEINCSFDDRNKKYFTYPIISTFQYDYPDHCEARSKGIAKNDIITYINARGQSKYPMEGKKKLFDNKPRTFMALPFSGCKSVYQGDYKCPELQCHFMSEMMCVAPDDTNSSKK